MIDPSPLVIIQALGLLSLLVGLCIFGLAFYGYRRNGSRAMLVLGYGIVTLTLGSTVVALLTSRLFSPAVVGIGSEATELVGMCLILYAIVLARRE
jgi:hypothetical protein